MGFPPRREKLARTFVYWQEKNYGVRVAKPPLWENGHAALPLGDLRHRRSEDGRRSPIDILKNRRIERRGPAADEVVATVLGGAGDPFAGVEKGEGVIDERSREAGVVDADGD